MMYVFSNCKAFIRTIPLLQYDEHKAEDLDTDGEDHAADESRYLCMARPIKPRMSPRPSAYTESAMYKYLGIEEKDIMRAKLPPRMEIVNGTDN
jgi:hypothetical protein